MNLTPLAQLFQARADARATLERSEGLIQTAMLDALAEYEVLSAEAARAAQALRETGAAPDAQAELASQARSAARAVLVELRHALSNRSAAGVDYAGARIVALAKEGMGR